MKQFLFFSCLFLLNYHTFAQQNLVPNPSFEQTDPNSTGYWWVVGWDRPPGSMTTPDHFSSTAAQGTDCAMHRGVPQNGMGYSYPKSGNSYVGFLQFYNQGGQTNSREYIQAQLSSQMQAGMVYSIGFYVKKSPRSTYAIDHFGVYLSDTAIHQNFNQPIAATPQLDLTGVLYDTTNWTLLQMNYTATGGESYITIGNFYPDAACNIVNTGQFDPWCWLNVNAAYHYIDSVVVTAAESHSVDNPLENSLSVYPNPAQDMLYISIENLQNTEISLCSLLGEKLARVKNDNKINIAHLPKGIYLVEICTEKGLIRKKIMKI